MCDLSKLIHAYFPINTEAFLSGTANHLQLTTEGGFTFALYIASLIHWELPFFVSAIFCILFLLVLTVVARQLSSSKTAAALSAILVIALIMLNRRLAYTTFGLALCLRDATAHFWGFLGFFICCRAMKISPIKKRKLLLGAFCIGISAWCRIPNILFIIPTSVYILTFINENKLKKTFKFLCITALGLILGIFPLICQNIFEGKPFYAVGQYETIVLKDAASSASVTTQESNKSDSPKKESVLSNHTSASSNDNKLQPIVAKMFYDKYNQQTPHEKGLSHKNFTFIYRSILKDIGRNLGPVLIILLIISIVSGMLLNKRMTLACLSGALAFGVFYSFYDKSVPRYNLIIIYFLLLTIAVSIADLSILILKKFNHEKSANVIFYTISLFLALLTFYVQKPFQTDLDLIRSERKYTIKLKNDIADLIDPGDYYICFSSRLTTSIHYLTQAVPLYWQLASSPVYMKNFGKYISRYERLLDSQNIYYIENYASPDYYKYWSKQDINLLYEMTPIRKIYPMFSNSTGFHIYKITKERPSTRKVNYNMPSDSESKLMLWTADRSNYSPSTQQVVFSATDISFTNKLIKGINIYNLPKDFLNESPELYVTSKNKTHLPIIIQSQLCSTNIIIDLNDYENMPGTTVTLNSTPFWHNKNDKWKREHRSRKNGYTDPLTALPIKTHIPINTTPDIKEIKIRLNIFATIESAIIREQIKQIKLSLNDTALSHTMKILKFTKKGERRFFTVELSAPIHTPHSQACTFNIDLSNANKIAVFADSINLIFK